MDWLVISHYLCTSYPRRIECQSFKRPTYLIWTCLGGYKSKVVHLLVGARPSFVSCILDSFSLHPKLNLNHIGNHVHSHTLKRVDNILNPCELGPLLFRLKRINNQESGSLFIGMNTKTLEWQTLIHQRAYHRITIFKHSHIKASNSTYMTFDVCTKPASKVHLISSFMEQLSWTPKHLKGSIWSFICTKCAYEATSIFSSICQVNIFESNIFIKCF